MSAEEAKRYTVSYSSNNSGGSWWLNDENWRALEAAGWEVEWVKEGDMMVRDGRFLGALATKATVQADSVSDAIREWERVTGEDAGAVGCNCCSQPHNFSWTENATGKRGHSELEVTSRWTVDA
jgi:hypothetical protein